MPFLVQTIHTTIAPINAAMATVWDQSGRINFVFLLRSWFPYNFETCVGEFCDLKWNYVTNRYL
jgi:hypothetical protein